MPNYYATRGSYPWYSRRNDIKKIIIEDGVTNIEYGAFYACLGLKSVTIPNSVTTIGEYAFRSCIGLTSVAIPNSVTTIGKYAFSECSGLISITIPNSVTNIGIYAFKECSALTSIVIPNSMIEIESALFYGCTSLISITIPNSVTSIGASTFYGCSSLNSITIPKSVRSIESGSFNGCSSLNSIIVENGNLIYDSRDNSNAIIETRSNTLIVGCKNSIIPESVTSIGNSAFYGCTGLTSITIPNSITKIRRYAFYNCQGLTSVSIPNSVSSIEESTFSGCSNLASVIINEGVKYIEGSAFCDCTGINSIIIPNSIKSIGSKAFYNCSSLTSLTCKAVIPPSCDDNCFSGVDKSIPLCVPGNCINAYLEAKQWNSFANIQAIIDNQSIADAVIEKINAIGEVEYSDVCKDKIDAVNTAYDALTDEQKALVTNLDVLTTAKQTYDNLKAAAEKLAADKAKADPVIAKINAIGKVECTDACKSKIDDATTAYNTLTEDQKAFVSNLDVLTTAQQTYDNLKAAAEKLAADKAKADAVIVKINAIGKVEYTNACKGKIDAASKAY